MVELCDLFPEDTGCQPRPDPLDDLTDPTDPADPVDPAATDPADEVVEEEPEEEEPEIEEPPKEPTKVIDEDPPDDDPVEEVEIVIDTSFGECFARNCPGAGDRYVYIKAVRDYANLSPLRANMVFLMMAAAQVAYAALMRFRYRGGAAYHVLGQFKNEVNWYYELDNLSNWAKIVVYGVLFVFQLLSTFGVLSETNYWIWYLGGLTAIAMHATEHFSRWLYTDVIWRRKDDQTVSNFYRRQSELLLPALEADNLATVVMEASALLVVFFNFEAWGWAQF